MRLQGRSMPLSICFEKFIAVLPMCYAIAPMHGQCNPYSNTPTTPQYTHFDVSFRSVYGARSRAPDDDMPPERPPLRIA
jgi:hypothetical protein